MAAQHHPHCYFADHVVLALGREETLFRIDRQVLLEHSKVFQRMLDTSDPETSERKGSSDEHPIRLPDDDPDYFAGILRVYYSTFLIPPDSNTPSFEHTLGVLRLASKYEFAHAIKWATDAIAADWSPQSATWLKTLDNPSQTDLKRAVALINISRELNIHTFLGCAFYLLCTDETWCGNSTVYGALSQSDALVLSRGIMSLWRHCAEQMRQGKDIRLRTALGGFKFGNISNASMGPPAAVSAPSGASTSTATSTSSASSWECFIRDPDTMRTVFYAIGFWWPTLLTPRPFLLGTSNPPSREAPASTTHPGFVSSGHKNTTTSVGLVNRAAKQRRSRKR
ncbi:hypothetical protein BOTBODRAFT_37049 [Botryobasidium botryosum FD-172 SS1]|uniref:BTB domain-containing protein n=1 Tax=Botryobasidium botryosum (strain FD-172 SS1) TaxID=930990 RepID=A0A067MD19_BOTB1|nr:hypothetical protein BOTBODRAFT_37049 [Botryobasidium botryosum FD-172 SS1]